MPDNRIENIETPKISIIMQSNLSDYPTSRKDSLVKFKRAVKSFENQTYKNIELVIVSDNCAKTHQIYNREFKSNPAIKFALLDRKQDEQLTYNEVEHDGNKYKIYRGAARNLGVAIASGSLITYMDSDDYLTPEFAQKLILVYNASKEYDWWLNKSWYDNQLATHEESSVYAQSAKDQPIITFPYIQSAWKETNLTNAAMMRSCWLLMHRADCNNIKWKDTYGNLSEDVYFFERFKEMYSNGTTYHMPMYIRCHYKNEWDI